MNNLITIYWTLRNNYSTMYILISNYRYLRINAYKNNLIFQNNLLELDLIGFLIPGVLFSNKLII